MSFQTDFLEKNNAALKYDGTLDPRASTHLVNDMTFTWCCEVARIQGRLQKVERIAFYLSLHALLNYVILEKLSYSIFSYNKLGKDANNTEGRFC